MTPLRILAVAIALSVPLGHQAAAQQPTPEHFKQMLELQKLAAETRKAQSEAKYFYMTYVGGAAAVLTILAGFTTFALQRRGARKDQKVAERGNLELKAMEYILDSPTPGMAALKLRIIRRTYAHVLSEEFREATKFLLPQDKNKGQEDENELLELPGTRLYDMKMESFKQLAGKYTKPNELIAALAAIFPRDEGRIVERLDKLIATEQPQTGLIITPQPAIPPRHRSWRRWLRPDLT
jgi:hypothetical protein